jgi:DNA-binding MarR family transcriptional regulator
MLYSKHAMRKARAHMTPTDQLVDDFLAASRALVGLAVRSVSASPVEVTLVQYRVLVLVSQGERTIGEIAVELRVNPSNATRQCDRLQRLGLVERRRSPEDGRVVRVALTAAGEAVVEAVTARRREEVRRVLEAMSVDDVEVVVSALGAFGRAARETSEVDWVSVLG